MDSRRTLHLIHIPIFELEGNANWTSISIKDPQPPGRVYHTASLLQNENVKSFMFIFGGSDSRGYFDDLWALDLST